MIVISTQSVLCFIVVLVIGASSILCLMVYLVLSACCSSFSCYVSNKRAVYFVFQRGQLAVLLLEIPISRNCSLVKWLKCLQLLNWCLIRACSIFCLIVKFVISA